jgi:hypothetical protein
MISFSQIYSKDQKIPELDRILPIELHANIGKYLGYSRHFYIIMRLLNNSKVTNEIKRYLHNNCYPYFNRLKHDDINYDMIFHQILFDNIHNSVEIHKILPLFYKKTHEEKFITSNEHIKINELLTTGYSLETERDNSFEDEDENTLTCHVYHVFRINEKPIIFQVTHVQTIIALLAQDLNYCFKRKGETKELYFQAYYKNPSLKKINKHSIKLKSKLKKKFVLKYNNGDVF